MGHPTIYPVGVTIYDRNAAWPGYTIFPAPQGALLIDMNGHEVHLWKGLRGEPNKILPGGFVIGSTGRRDSEAHPFDNFDLAQQDWDGNNVWLFNRNEHITDPGNTPRWIARQHHDYQREGSSTGYYAPGAEPKTHDGNTLILVNREAYIPNISGKVLLDNSIIEVNWEGNIVWRWNAADHFEEFGFDENAKNLIYRLPSDLLSHGGKGFWFAVNSVSTLGPNKWYDGGDERFHPDNIILSGRNVNILAVISKKTGNVVWRLGPDCRDVPFGQIIGPNHIHLIPKGLPGEGNFLVFDNGGWAGYGVPNGISRYGAADKRRDYSRVLEFDPVTLALKWQYTPAEAGHIDPLDSYKFYSPFISSVQRLPNGNTLITEGCNGRIFEVTPEHKTVWEYVTPYTQKTEGGAKGGLVNNWIYRAYRVPYEWIPQLPTPEETAVSPLNVSRFRVPGSPVPSGGKVTVITGINPHPEDLIEDPFNAEVVFSGEVSNFCVINSGERKISKNIKE
ncbi:MAG: aryl-sulfate sulfotransferase [Spirochaetaceae bacterium]|jgi:hypothetical protein|nr:aryl-sulfate sulfotransferase [Spirochaetaceae bacterium]